MSGGAGGGRRGPRNEPSLGELLTQIYTPATDSWSRGPNMPFDRSGMGAAAFAGGRFFIMGGEVPVGAHPKASPEGVFNQVQWSFHRNTTLCVASTS